MHSIRHEVHPLIDCKVAGHLCFSDGDGIADRTPVFRESEIVLPFFHLGDDSFVLVQSLPLRRFGQELVANHDADVMAQMVGSVDTRAVRDRQGANLGEKISNGPLPAVKSDEYLVAISFQSRSQAIQVVTGKSGLVVRQHLMAGNDHLLNFCCQDIKAGIEHLHLEGSHKLLDEFTGFFLFDFLAQIALNLGALLLQLTLTGKHLLAAPIDADEVVAPFAAHGFGDLMYRQGKSGLGKIRIHLVIGQKSQIAAVGAERRILKCLGGNLFKGHAGIQRPLELFGLLFCLDKKVTDVDALQSTEERCFDVLFANRNFVANFFLIQRADHLVTLHPFGHLLNVWRLVEAESPPFLCEQLLFDQQIQMGA